MFPGQNYQKLADFLSRPYESFLLNNSTLPFMGSRNIATNAKKVISQDQSSFLALYHYSPSSPLTSANYGADQHGWKCFEQQREVLGPRCAQILFMRGLALPEWLNQIGSTFRVDPEYFRRHLMFLQPYEQFDMPGLPCTSKNFVHLPLVTNGTRGGSGDQSMSGGTDLVQDRHNANMKISMYLRQLDKRVKMLANKSSWENDKVQPWKKMMQSTELAETGDWAH